MATFFIHIIIISTVLACTSINRAILHYLALWSFAFALTT